MGLHMHKSIKIIELVLLFFLIVIGGWVFRDIHQIRTSTETLDIRRTYHFAVLTDEMDSHAYERFMMGIDSESNSYKMVYEHYLIDPLNHEEQFLNVSLTEVDGVIIKLSNHGEMASSILRLKEQGIKVVLVGNDAPETHRDLYIGTNKFLMGKESAQMAIEANGPKGKMALILGSDFTDEQSAGYRHFLSGVTESLLHYDDFQLSHIQMTHNQRAELVMDDLLNLETSPDVVICTDPLDVQRIIRVLVDRNAVGLIKVVSNGRTPEIEEYIDQNMVYASLIEDHYAIGQLAVSHTYQLLNDEVVSNYINVPFETIKKATLEELLQR